MKSAFPAAAKKEADRRAADRYAGHVPVQVLTKDGVVIAGEMTNVSRSGFRMRSPMLVTRGSLVVVRTHDGLRRRARVIWQEGTFIGCRFLKPLTPETLEDLLGVNGG